ncbi:GNAT family N-acetyltransferase [Sandaracinobacter neustonicus]|uniref:GNAT family N-acetyltransferase n=1 Tax=Sandaracinobacter neustonicus TaxID=1715348 RepID=A0A501XEQ8_9SPHN|nr:GNAT family N-acetyltransferase [Sandaracinobacter neustonicus]TPE58784.1 GNAT family N-acetyltransferase [Sandaracinobacter neustonicus]
MIETERLILRAFIDSDREPWAAMNADAQVMRHFPALLSRAEADAVIERVNSKIAETGAGFWALERKSDGQFLGFAGLNQIGHEHLPIYGQWEVGWRLRREAWGHGYASEAGAAALAHGFGPMALPRILAYTAITNKPSEAVMQRLGMRRAAEMDFEHPLVPEGNPIRPHIVYLKEA